MKKLLIALTSLFFLMNSASAMFHVEPYLGYAKGSGDKDASDPNDVNDPEYKGLGFGARLGLNYMGLLIGGTYDSNGLTLTDDDAPNAEVDYKGTNMGLFVGYDFPLGLRLWLSYYLSADFEVDTINNANSFASGDELSGSGYSIGAGYSIIPMILSLNLEYKSFTYDEFKDGETGQTVNLTRDSELSYLFLSVSAPLSF